MPVCRVILRVDFSTSFEIMDRPGSLARTIIEAKGPEFFSQVVEAKQGREIVAQSKTELFTREFKAGPTFVLFDYQNFEGQTLDNLKDDESFAGLVSVVTAVRREFKIEAEGRAGFRLYYLSQIAKSYAEVRAAFERLMSPEIVSSVSKNLSPPTDVAFNFDGGVEDGRQYHVRAGPFLGKVEAPRYFHSLPKASKLLETSDFICDVDQYLSKTKHGPDLQWWKPLVQSTKELVSSLESVLRAKLKVNKNGTHKADTH